MFEAGRIVEALAGRDTGRLFYVIGEDPAKARILLADGKGRKVQRPKEKKPGHVEAVDGGEFPHRVTRKLQNGEPVTNRELREALGAFKGVKKLGKS